MADPSNQPFGSEFLPVDLERVVAESLVNDIDYHLELDSTNDRSLQLARQKGNQLNTTLVLAARQTVGRGRGENRWWSNAGALTFSLLMPNGSLSLPSVSLPQTSLLAALAVGNAIENSIRAEAAQLKWPNDVYLRGRKVCGILVEAISGSNGALVVGIGLNVNNSISDAPDELRAIATSLCDVAGGQLSSVELLITILQQFELHLNELREGKTQLQQQWQERCLLDGHTVHVDTPTGSLTGVCRGIDNYGALLLETDLSIERCLAGTVTQIT